MLTIEGNIVSAESTSRGRIEIGNDGLISSVSPETGTADIILKDELIFPGFIDLHVHARECANHSQDYKEDFKTAGQAAINGGVVAFAEMPNNPVPPVDDGSYAAKKELTKKSPVDILLYAGIGPKTLPLSINVPYKVYMGKSVGDLFFENFSDLDEALKKYQGQNVSFHCEDPVILEQDKNQPTHELRRPKEAEVSAIDFALEVIEKYNLNGKICHCSTAEGIEKIRQAKKRGVTVTAEASPHHLYFDASMLTSSNSSQMQMNPPLRNPKDRQALLEALRDGTIDYLATDHAPHTIEEKQKGTSGTPQLDTYGPFVAWLMKEQGFSPLEIARVCSVNPGQFIERFTGQKYGRIAKGFVGSLTVMDMNKAAEVNKTKLKTKCGWSAFEGVKFPGSVVYTVVRGKVYSQ